ncbi:hypothetical protein Q5P01_015392 [Channa striata]|uniref:Matrin-type domain-containing protein n=1 Tax=Channa striata TaxID=64152 RepID=A0AA88MH90_CHASR|nr:hypothetical protein Q5P01_015392 [Channa striata]
MVRPQRRTDRCFQPAAGNTVTWVQFPVCPVQRRPPPPQQASGRKRVGPGTACADSRPCSSSITTEEERGDLLPHGVSGETESKRVRLDGGEEADALTNRDKVLGSCGQSAEGVSSRAPPPDQQGSAELSELQNVGSLKVTIQQSSESREFGATDRATGGLHCHVCNLTCRTLQVFQEHMSGAEHVRKLQEITDSICINAHALQGRGCRADSRRWCDTCQTQFSGDVVAHRRTKPHKMCKQLCRPFCPVCKRHFRTPRKFVEHMKSPEHKQQVQLEEAQDEELITVDAIGCFEEEEEEEEEEVDVADEEDEDVGTEEAEAKQVETENPEEASGEECDEHATYGSSFVVPVSGFLCQLCNKFFYKETTARHTHCRTQTHYRNLQQHRAQRRT